MVRKFNFQEEIKILMSEVFRDGNLTDIEWTYKYELLKEKTPLDTIGQTMSLMVQNDYSIEQSREVIKNMLLERKNKAKINDI